MCGVVGIVGSPEASKEAFLGLIALQHRGQDAAGILSYADSFHDVKNIGLVENVFTREAIESLPGDMAIGHARYSTVGKNTARAALRDVQPLTLNFPYGVGLVHNGNIVNYHRLKERLTTEKKRRCFSTSDTEALLNWLADELRGNSFEGLKVAVRSLFNNVQGSYSIVGLTAEGGLFAFRDPSGIRPLILGKKLTESGALSYMVASESIALQVNHYEIMRDVEPGELIFIRPARFVSTSTSASAADVSTSGQAQPEFHSGKLVSAPHRPCMFEWVYFASAESEIDGAPVYGARLELGRQAAKNVAALLKEKKIKVDIVAPVPDTSRTAASAIAEELSLPYREVLIKNRYIKRTFILGTNAERARAVDLKLLPVKSEIIGKHVLLVDDSIVRGTTSKKIVELVRKAGALSVTFLSTCPPIRYPCFYGIDFPESSELLAAGRSEDEIAKTIGADAVIYLDTKALTEALATVSKGSVTTPCTACLTGEYPTDVSESVRFTAARKKERGEQVS